MAKDYIMLWEKWGPEALGGGSRCMWTQMRKVAGTFCSVSSFTSFQRAQRSLTGFLAEMQTMSDIWEARRALNWKAELHVHFLKKSLTLKSIFHFSLIKTTTKPHQRLLLFINLFKQHLGYEQVEYSKSQPPFPFQVPHPAFLSRTFSGSSWDLKVAGGVFCTHCPGWVLHKPHQ